MAFPGDGHRIETPGGTHEWASDEDLEAAGEFMDRLQREGYAHPEESRTPDEAKVLTITATSNVLNKLMTAAENADAWPIGQATVDTKDADGKPLRIVFRRGE